MASKTELSEFVEFIGHDGSELNDNPKHPWGRQGFSEKEIAAYMIHHGMGLGVGFDVTGHEEKLPMMFTHVTLDGNAAIIDVMSEVWPGYMHSILWSGEQAFDPNPDSIDDRPLSDYQILSVYPIVWFDE